MGLLLLGIGVFLVIRFIFLPFLRRGSGKNSSTYRPVSFLSPAEKKFLSALDMFVNGRARICAKVRLADLVVPDAPYKSKAWFTAFNRVSAKHIDFVLVSSAGLVLAGIELDDSSHSAADRIERDNFVGAVFAQVKIPLIRIPVRASYSREDLKALDKFLTI